MTAGDPVMFLPANSNLKLMAKPELSTPELQAVKYHGLTHFFI